jgi:hypothetical protein
MIIPVPETEDPSVMQEIPTTEGESFVTISGIDIASSGAASCSIVGKSVLSVVETVLSEVFCLTSAVLSEEDVVLLFENLSLTSEYPTTELAPIAHTQRIASAALSTFLLFFFFGG